MNNTRQNSVKEIISEMKLLLNEPSLTLENFIMPEGFEGDDQYQEDSFSEGEPRNPHMDKDAMPQMEEDRNDISGIEKELTQIRKIALSVINRLADQPQSPQYDTMKKIWNMVDKAIEQPAKGNAQNMGN